MVQLAPSVTKFYMEHNEAVVHIKHCYTDGVTLAWVPGWWSCGFATWLW